MPERSERILPQKFYARDPRIVARELLGKILVRTMSHGAGTERLTGRIVEVEVYLGEGDLAAHGWQDIVPYLHRKSVEGDWNGMADLITDEMVDSYAVTGTYTTISQKIRERYAGLIDRTALYQKHQPNLDDPRLARLVQEFNE